MYSPLKSRQTSQDTTKAFTAPDVRWLGCFFFVSIFLSILWGCAVAPKKLLIEGTALSFDADAIISTQTGKSISFDALINDLSTADVIYIGEKHTDPAHHAIQLKVIQRIFDKYPDTVVGMEMFDRTYQPILDRWSAGKLDEQDFLEKVHWYANWKFDFGLYRDILRYIKDHHIQLIGLNLPFHIPPKIAVGGIENLSEEDRKHLAEKIDTTNTRHRAYVEAIFKHHRLHGRENFDYFYAAQCAWEDTMAESVARHPDHTKMIVLAGTGHIIRKFGIPDRAFRRTHKPFKTIYPAPAGGKIRLDVADYIWVTP